MNSQTPKPLLSLKTVILAPFVLFGGTVALHFILKLFQFQIKFIMATYWPISIIEPKLPHLPDLLTLSAIICLAIALWKAFQAKRSFILQLGIVWLLVIASNLLQGYQAGFIRPSDSGADYDVGYWNDAETIYNPINFIKNYTIIQPKLGYHSRSHPPLPTLIYYHLQQISQNALVANLILSLVSMGSIWFLYHWLKEYTSDSTAQFVSLLVGLSAAVQIYSLATIDIIIATAFTATLWAFDRPHKQVKTLLSSIFLSVSCLLTFCVVWIFPVMVVIDYVRHKNIVNFLQVVGGTVLTLYLLYLITGYSYLEGFFIAKNFENSSIFSFSPIGIVNYLSSRIADIAEHILFLGPYISLLLIRAYKASSKKIFDKDAHFFVVSLASICSFLGFIATGAYYTGETARNAFYIIPPILTILAPYFDRNKLTTSDQRLLIILVISQTTLMQLFGYYCW